MRRILIIILIIVLAWAGIYIFYIKPRQTSVVSPVPNILKPFFPTSTTTTGSFGSANVIGTAGTTANGTPSVPIFKQLTNRPVAGYSVYDLTTQVSVPSTDPKAKPTVQTVTDHYIRYVSQPNGYVYEIKDGAVPLQITNIFIPNIYEAGFADNNNTAIVRFLRSDNKTIATYSIPIPSANNDGSRTQQSGTYLPDNIYELAVSPDETQIARITTNSSGSIISTSTSVGTKIKTAVRSPFIDWLPSWSGNTLYLQTKAASVADGFLYSVNQTTTQLRRILGNIAGLTTSISPDGSYILYSQSTDGGFTTSIVNTKTNATTNLNLSILPEKCAWLKNDDLICAGNNSVPNNTYPDAWYAGTVHFSDQLYRITTSSNIYTVLYDNQGHSFDMTDLQVDENQQLVYFIDKSTGYLWQFSY